jgi:hypothetical protein
LGSASGAVGGGGSGRSCWREFVNIKENGSRDCAFLAKQGIATTGLKRISWAWVVADTVCLPSTSTNVKRASAVTVGIE